jgi:hypothetical protein
MREGDRILSRDERPLHAFMDDIHDLIQHLLHLQADAPLAFPARRAAGAIHRVRNDAHHTGPQPAGQLQAALVDGLREREEGR